MPPVSRQAKKPVFNAPLHPALPLNEVWQAAQPYEILSPRFGMRYYGPDRTLIRATKSSGNYHTSQQDIRQVEHQHDILQRAGMLIVSHLSEVHLRDKTMPGTSLHVTVTASKYIANTLPLSNKRIEKSFPRTVLHYQVLKPLRSYLDWIDTEKPPQVLGDIYDPFQYSWQKGTANIFLHDIEPVLMPNRPGLTNQLAAFIVQQFKPVAPAVALYF